jgi:hypothetical protein
VQSGIEFGRTDDFRYNIAENPVHLRNLHATMFHIEGIDHKRFTMRRLRNQRPLYQYLEAAIGCWRTRPARLASAKTRWA